MRAVFTFYTVVLISAHTTEHICALWTCSWFCTHKTSHFLSTSGSWRRNHLLCKGASYMKGKGMCKSGRGECRCKAEGGYRLCHLASLWRLYTHLFSSDRHPGVISWQVRSPKWKQVNLGNSELANKQKALGTASILGLPSLLTCRRWQHFPWKSEFCNLQALKKVGDEAGVALVPVAMSEEMGRGKGKERGMEGTSTFTISFKSGTFS